jgi:hypothetical protein
MIFAITILAVMATYPRVLPYDTLVEDTLSYSYYPCSYIPFPGHLDDNNDDDDDADADKTEDDDEEDSVSSFWLSERHHGRDFHVNNVIQQPFLRSIIYEPWGQSPYSSAPPLRHSYDSYDGCARHEGTPLYVKCKAVDYLARGRSSGILPIDNLPMTQFEIDYYTSSIEATTKKLHDLLLDTFGKDEFDKHVTKLGKEEKEEKNVQPLPPFVM